VLHLTDFKLSYDVVLTIEVTFTIPTKLTTIVTDFSGQSASAPFLTHRPIDKNGCRLFFVVQGQAVPWADRSVNPLTSVAVFYPFGV
jgi:hypothetical protein